MATVTPSARENVSVKPLNERLINRGRGRHTSAAPVEFTTSSGGLTACVGGAAVNGYAGQGCWPFTCAIDAGVTECGTHDSMTSAFDGVRRFVDGTVSLNIRTGRALSLPTVRYMMCQGSCLSSPEVCNGRDDNCNGLIDEGFSAAECPPPARDGGVVSFAAQSLEYDSVSDRLIAVGPLASIFLATGTSWTALDAGTIDSRSFATAFDEQRNRLVLFGGLDFLVHPTNNTWELDGGTWVMTAPLARPPARHGARMAYDAARKQIVLFGGQTPTTFLQDTWSYDGVTWTQHSISVPPAPRDEHAMAYDPVRRVVVLHGGKGFNGAFDDTWEWDGANWTPSSTISVGARSGHRMAYDTTRNRLVLYGRNVPVDVWERAGTSWASVPSSLGPTMTSAMAFDPRQQYTVVIAPVMPSGSSEVWLWDGRGWR